jgi:hypothetical protein
VGYTGPPTRTARIWAVSSARSLEEAKRANRMMAKAAEALAFDGSWQLSDFEV